MTITYHPQVVQGSQEWFDMRCGMLTASEVKLLLTEKTMKIANNDKVRSHVYELAAQRITKYVEPHYISDDMLRGKEEEILAAAQYAKKYDPVHHVGFVTNDKWGFSIGYSPDGLVGDEGQIECKSRRQKYQVETVLETIDTSKIPADFIMQVQTGLLVTERAWCDFISYSNGMHMLRYRVYPDHEMHMAIIDAAAQFEKQIQEKVARYMELTSTESLHPDLTPTVRRDTSQDIIV